MKPILVFFQNQKFILQIELSLLSLRLFFLIDLVFRARAPDKN